jgi:8-oxo-dGTP diphosphatase
MSLLNQSNVDLIVTGKESVSVPHSNAYVCGFLTHRDEGTASQWVALIEKRRPTWQAGKLNGIGGKIETGESPRQAMVREFEEETGFHVDDWRCFAILRHNENLIYMFTAEHDLVPLQQITDEAVDWYAVSIVSRPNVIANLRWLVPMALSGNKEVAVIADEVPFAVTTT